jgi:hypothetical protein
MNLRSLPTSLCLLVLPLTFFLTSVAFSEEAKKPAAKESGDLDLSQFPGQVMEDVLIPVPSEIFGVLDKLGNPDWKKEIRTGLKVTFSDRAEIALLLGSVVADGFIAVQAQDPKAVQAIGSDVLSLSKALGVKEAVLPHCNSIAEAAQAKDWETVRRELDATQRTVRQTMDKMKDNALAECVSVGGWLRGTQVVTTIIKDSYSADKAELLNQPELVDYFRKSMTKASGQLKKTEKLKLILAGLGQIQAIMGKGDTTLSAEGVAQVHRITGDLVQHITSKN